MKVPSGRGEPGSATANSADIRAAFCEHAPPGWCEREQNWWWQTAQTVLRRAGIKAPFSGPELEAAMQDPGALCETRLMDVPRVESGTVYARDSLEVLHCQALLQNAAYFARAPRGFDSIQQSPELAEVISRCCYELLEACARDDASSAAARDCPALLWLLAPAHRVCLLAEVAAAFCCPGQPLPPSTPEHCAAFLAFVLTATRCARFETMHVHVGRLKHTGARATHVVGYLHRHSWPSPHKALCTLRQRAWDVSIALQAALMRGARPGRAEGVVLLMSLYLSAAGGLDEALQGLSQAWVGGGRMHQFTTTHQQTSKNSPANVQDLAEAVRALCSLLKPMHKAHGPAFDWCHAVDRDESADHGSCPEAAGSTGVGCRCKCNSLSSSSSGRGGVSSSNSNGGSGSSCSGCGCGHCGCHMRPLPAGHAALLLQLQATGLALIWQYYETAMHTDGCVVERCPERTAQLLLAHQSAFSRARLHAWLGADADAEARAVHEGGGRVTRGRRQQQQEEQQEQGGHGMTGASGLHAVLSFLSLLRRFEQEDAAAAEAEAQAAGPHSTDTASTNGGSRRGGTHASRSSSSSGSSSGGSSSGDGTGSSGEHADLPLGLRASLASHLAYKQRTLLQKNKLLPSGTSTEGCADQHCQEGEKEGVASGQSGAAFLGRVPHVALDIAERDAAMELYVEECAEARRLMQTRSGNKDPCPLCENERRQQRRRQRRMQGRQQQRRQQQQQHQQQQQQECACDSARSDALHSGRPHSSRRTNCCSSAHSSSGDCAGSCSIGNFSSSACFDSSSAHWQRPDPSSPFMWRQLVWQLFERLKPCSAAALRRLGGCPHVDDPMMWNDIRHSLTTTLLPMEHDADWQLVRPRFEDMTASEQRDEVMQRMAQHARAATAQFVQGTDSSVLAGLLSAHVLMVLDPFEESLLPEQSLMEWWPSSYAQLLGRFLQEEAERCRDPLLLAARTNFSKLPLLWHMHMRQRWGGDYSSRGARYAALRAAFAQLQPEELPALVSRRPLLPQALWVELGLVTRDPACALNHGACERPGCAEKGAHLVARCGACGCAAYCSELCKLANEDEHRATACRHLARVKASPQLWRVLSWIPPRRLEAMRHIANCDLLQCMPQHAHRLWRKQMQQVQLQRKEQQKAQQQQEKEKEAQPGSYAQQHGRQQQQDKGQCGAEDAMWEKAYHAAWQRAEKQASKRLQRVPASCQQWHERACAALPKRYGGCPSVVVHDNVRMEPVYPFSRHLQMDTMEKKPTYHHSLPRTVTWIE